MLMLYTVFKMPFIDVKRFIYDRDGRMLEERKAKLIEPLKQVFAVIEAEEREKKK